MAELADALGSGPSGGNTVGVRVPSSASPEKKTSAPYGGLMFLFLVFSYYSFVKLFRNCIAPRQARVGKSIAGKWAITAGKRRLSAGKRVYTADKRVYTADKRACSADKHRSTADKRFPGS